MTPPRSPRPDRRSGFSLIELLIAMTMLVAITGVAWSLFQSQSTSFRANIDRWEMVANARAAMEGSARMIRTMGAGVAPGQPILVYGAGTVLAFNSDYVESDTTDMRWAAYFNPDAPSGETMAWDVAQAGVIPNSSPGYTYPSETYQLANGATSPAETYILYFALDSSTSRGDDYVLYQRVNAGNPEVLARNILPHPDGHPFFQYLMKRVGVGGDTLLPVPAGDLPLIRRPLVSGLSASDSADYVRPDSVRAVRMDFRLSNGRTGIDERDRDVTTVIQVPNNGVTLPTVCGRDPLAPSGLTVVDTVPGSGRLWFTWTASADQDAGEHDIHQYILYRRPGAATSWTAGGPVEVVKAVSGQSSYTAEVAGNTPGKTYLFGVAAEDCTPAESSITTLSVTPST
jgi:prepilin-type N-terminal cleavage/methylation domain-containing protein